MVKDSNSVRASIAAMHRKLESLWREDVRHYIGLLGAELKRYRASYESDFRGGWRPSSADQLLKAVARSNLVFSGDYHTLPAAQRLPIRLLRSFVREGRKITIALEMLHSRDQDVVNEFLAGRIGSRTLRRRIGFDHLWGFDWMQYHAILEFARREKVGVLAINSDPGGARNRLARRDRHAADLLRQHLLHHPGDLLFVLAGDWHVARNHLPRQALRLAREAGLAPRTLVIHQNHEALYRRFSGAADGVPDVVRRGRNLFCVLNTAPHVKAQAHVRWALESSGLENPDQADDWSLHDPSSDFWEIVSALAGHLKIPFDRDLSVYGSDHMEILENAARSSGVSRTRLEAWRRDLEAGRPVYLPESRTVLLGRARLNRVAEEAGRRLRRPFRHRGRRTRASNFYELALEHGIAFFSSRLINPLRKCDLVDDLIGRGTGTVRQRYEAAWARFFRSGGDVAGISRPSHPFWRSSSPLRQNVARTVGAIWGYYLYDTYISGRIDPTWVRALFLGTLPLSPEEAFVQGSSFEEAPGRVSSKMALL
jgi:hypothetical protein